MDQLEEKVIHQRFSELLGKQKKELQTQMQQQLDEFEAHRKTVLTRSQNNPRINGLKEDSLKRASSEGILNGDQQFKKLSNIIKINVGGKRFTTTLTTLTSKRDSMLAAMFSGRFEIEKDEDGYFFLDRNGKYFSYILDYLRTGEFSSSLNEDVLADVKKEAAYYQIYTPDPEPEKFTSDCATLQHHGIYYDGETAYSFIDDDKTVIFSNGTGRRQEYYSVDSFNFVHVNQFQLFIHHNHLAKNATIFKYLKPTLPVLSTPYTCSQCSNRITFRKDQLILENYAIPPVDKYSVPISYQTSNYGVPIIITEIPIDGFSWDGSSRMSPIFYCYGKVIVARAGLEVRLFVLN